MADKPLKPKEVTELLSKLKSTTPDYPADLMAARRAAFVKKAIAVKLEGRGPGGQHGGSGGSGSTTGGTATGQGFFWQAAIGVLVVAAMLVASFIYREQIINLLDGNGVVTQVESPAPSSTDISTPTPVATTPTPSALATPTLTDIVTTDTPTTGTLEPGDIIIINGTPFIVDASGTPVVVGTKDNPGLHLGETPGTPAAPGQGNPGNTNQPPKPTKAPKPTKPPKPTKAKSK